MPVFSYEALDKSNNIINGRLEAQHQSEALDRLKQTGITVFEIEEAKDKKKILSSERKVTISDLSMFSRQLAAMLEAGIPVTRALFTLSRQATNRSLGNALDTIAKNIEAGMSVGEAFKQFPNIFSELYLGMIDAGEAGGTLSNTLARLSDQLQKEKSLKDSVRSATFYPSMVGGFALIVMLGMLVFLVPVFQGFFSADAVMPLPTKIIISFSESIRFYWYIWLFAFIFILIGIKYYIKSPSGKKNWDIIRFKLPIFGGLIHRSVIARFARTFSTLLAGGISVVQALEKSGPTSGSILVSEAVTLATERIHEGRNIAEPLEESGIFPPMVIHMIEVGEETGALPSLLAKIAEFYEDEVAIMAKGLTAMIEPLMLILVGVIVGGMLISLYLPMFTVITQVGG